MSRNASTKRAGRLRETGRSRSAATARDGGDTFRLASGRSGRPVEGRPDASDEDHSREEVWIELTGAQVNHVLRTSAESASVPSLLAGLGDLREALVEKSLSTRAAEFSAQTFSRSLLVGLLVLACFPPDGGYLGNIDVARKVELSNSTAHRYLSTLVLAGLLERDPSTRKYRRPTPS